MKKAEAAGNDNCPVKIKLVAPPLYVLTTQTLDKVGITLVLNPSQIVRRLTFLTSSLTTRLIQKFV